MSELEIWRRKLVETGARIRHMLAQDGPVFFTDQVRTAFIDAPNFADALDDGTLSALKAATKKAADSAGAALEAGLDDTVWLAAEAPGADDTTLLSLAPVARAITEYDEALRTFFASHGLPGEPVGYRLPARFIDGDNLVSLTRDLWKAVGQRDRIAAETNAQAVASSNADRSRRWDDA